ncbi:MAG: hypothetical protein RL196_1003 [Actinomycetota bacterium]|jgi:cell division protein ZapE
MPLAPVSLVSRNPQISVEQLLKQLVPPREFATSSFDNYITDSRFDSQAQAVRVAHTFATGKKFGLDGATAKQLKNSAGVYLDGGFGVGKTHLLAATWHAFKGKKVFGSFLAFTGLIGVLGFANAVKALGAYDLICIDEFELDDPGDTMMMSRLLSELAPKGVKFAATSNTPPNALGQGRFAAADFAREISAMADRFTIITVDGEDYRHRPTESSAVALSDDLLAQWVSTFEPTQVALDDFATLLKHLSTLHPSRYLQLLDNVNALGVQNAFMLYDQVAALRWVALVDRLYENKVALRATGIALTACFSDEMIGGAYRKKYLRAISRLGALSEL